MKKKEKSSKVLLITPFHRSRRGNSLTSERLQKGLTGKGFSIDLLSLEERNWLEILRQGLAEQRYGLIHGFHASRIGRVIKSEPDIKNVPLIITMTGTDINYDIKGSEKDILLGALQVAQKIVVFNRDFKETLVKLNPELGEKTAIIPQGVVLEEGRPVKREDVGLSARNIVFLLPSGLRPVKNIKIAIQMLEKVQQRYSEVRLLIIGAALDQEYSRFIESYIRNLPWVVYIGEIPHEEMKNTLMLGDIVINTSLAEGQPQGALEAMSLGKPALLTAVPGNLNIIENGREGFYVSNAEEMYAAAESLVNNIFLREKMGKAAKILLENKYTQEQELNRHQKIYRQILSEPNMPTNHNYL